jgi:hypothetical protein
VGETVAASSAVQSAKGLLTAGMARSAVYLLDKWRKRQAGLQQPKP